MGSRGLIKWEKAAGGAGGSVPVAEVTEIPKSHKWNASMQLTAW